MARNAPTSTIMASNVSISTRSFTPSLNMLCHAQLHRVITSTAPVPTGPKMPRNVLDIDMDDALRGRHMSEPRMAKVIHSTQIEQDKSAPPAEDYLARPYSPVTATLRNTYVEVMIVFHSKFNLPHPTLFLAVHIFDKVLASLKPTANINHLQLACSGCLFIAHKLYESPSLPMISFIQGFGNVFSQEDLQNMESYIFRIMGWNLSLIHI